jgi:hypothetical protein
LYDWAKAGDANMALRTALTSNFFIGSISIFILRRAAIEPLAERTMGMKALNRLLGIAGLVSALLRTLQGLHAQIECHNCGINSRSRDLRANNAHPMSAPSNQQEGGSPRGGDPEMEIACRSSSPMKSSNGFTLPRLN